MKILVIGDSFHFDECRQKLGDHQYAHHATHERLEQILEAHDITFDFIIEEKPEAFQCYAERPVVAFFNTCLVRLAALAASSVASRQCKSFGFNGLPTLFNREILELSLLNSDDAATLDSVCRQLNTKYVLVDDRVGMVTPRIMCMIINEAYYTVQEGTATRKDIDLAMKLGTNYPYGPFAWCERLGLKNVYRLLEAVYEETRDERYRIAPLMKTEYLRSTADKR